MYIIENKKANIFCIPSNPLHSCGFSTFSTDLENSLKNMFGSCLDTMIFPFESAHEKHDYDHKITRTLNKDNPEDYWKIAYQINTNPDVALVIIQHEFGLFHRRVCESIEFLNINE